MVDSSGQKQDLQYKTGPRRINSIFHRPSFVMGNSFCSVRDDHCCCSVHDGVGTLLLVGSRTSVDQKFDQAWSQAHSCRD